MSNIRVFRDVSIMRYIKFFFCTKSLKSSVLCLGTSQFGGATFQVLNSYRQLIAIVSGSSRL